MLTKIKQSIVERLRSWWMPHHERWMAREIGGMIERELAEFKYTPSGNTIGTPWSEQKVFSYIDRLQDALVMPYVQRFKLQETYEQARKSPPDEADYWVVAVTERYLEYYDPRTGEFGLATPQTGEELPTAIGVRGDLVGTFCAM